MRIPVRESDREAEIDSHGRTPRLLLAEALAMTLLARAATSLIPFPWLLRLLVSAKPGVGPGDPGIISHVCYSVSRIAHWPALWAVCLPQALAAHWMLARRAIPTQIRFGVLSGPGTLSAHAWLVCGNRAILGQQGGRAYQPIFEFPPQGAA